MTTPPPRRGFTLWELVMVLVVLAATLGVAVPAWVRFGAAGDDRPLDAFLAVLRDARRAAIAHRAHVALVVDPETGRWRADTLGDAGAGPLAGGTLALAAAGGFDTDSARLRWRFRPDGAATASEDTVRVRTADGAAMIVVDAWSGRARVAGR